MSPATSALVLKLAAWGVMGFALILATGSYPAIDAPARFALDLLDWPMDGNHAEISRDMRWMLAVVSGLLVLLSSVLIWIIAPQVEQGNRSVARVTFWAIFAWMVIDCAGSVAAGVASNAVWNAGFALPFLIALGMMKPEKAA